jgi:hypothetical protein
MYQSSKKMSETIPGDAWNDDHIGDHIDDQKNASTGKDVQH